MDLHNLPTQPTSFIGCSDEIAEITNLLNKPNCRLLTLVGTGGIGKTRLAVEVALNIQDTYDNGAVFVALQPIATPEQIIPALAKALEFKFYEGPEQKEQLLSFLHGKNTLLILDNFEHLSLGATLVTEILSNASQIQLLVTSREALNLREEWLYRLKGMPYPEGETWEIEDYSALQLFQDRARQINANFSLTNEQGHIARICELVEGMPLALELAATWLKSLSCQAIANQIEENLNFLTTTLRDMPDRHRSIHAVFEQSWNLLKPEERTAGIDPIK